MILSYQRRKFAFTEFDEDGNEYGQIWKIADFYADFPFLPQLDFNEVDSINFDDERPLYLIVYFERLNKDAIAGKTPDIHPFFQAIEENKQTIKNRAYELIQGQSSDQEPGRDIVADLDTLKAEFMKLKSDVEILKATKEPAK